jgi:DNA polymerase III epsilon subunit-like protein
MAATEIHGITDEDVQDAPVFSDIAPDIIHALSGTVMAAYNVYFDLQFLQFELRNADAPATPPHLCLMYLRPLLGIGKRCRLSEACQCHGIEHLTSHESHADVQACIQLLRLYLQNIRQRGIATFDDLNKIRKYKFSQSFSLPPIATDIVSDRPRSGRRKSRAPASSIETPQKNQRQRMAEYWDALTSALADLTIEPDELAVIERLREQLEIPQEEVRTLHARAFASIVIQFSADRRLDDKECSKLQRLYQCLDRLGYAPGQPVGIHAAIRRHLWKADETNSL